MSAQWAVGEAEMRRTSQPKRAMRPLQGSSATIEVAEEPLRLSPSHLFTGIISSLGSLPGDPRVNLTEVNELNPKAI